MPPTSKAVLISLADNANDQGYCWPSIPTIANRTCFSERAVQGAIKWLEQHGAVRADRSNGRHTTYQVTPQTYIQPPQELRRLSVEDSVDTPAGNAPQQNMPPAANAPTPAGAAPAPPQEVRQPPQEVPSNRKEPSLEPSKNRQKGSASSFVLPDWIPEDVWQAYLEMRKKIRKVPTDYACKLVVKELARLRDAGHDVVASLDQSIRSNWTDVYAPKAKDSQSRGSPGRQPSPENFAAVDYGTSGKL
jgi:hypothetical protein